MVGNFEKFIIVTGHFGTGKTNLALNIAMDLKKLSRKVAIVDFDTVNPYFRTSDNKEMLMEQGIDVIVSPYANTNVDIPAIPAEINSVFALDYDNVIFDVGGDDDGAVALGTLYRFFKNVPITMLCVINGRRPLISEPKYAAEMVRNIELASRLCVTGLINNTHLQLETDAETVLESVEYAQKVSELSGKPVLMTAVYEPLCKELAKKVDGLYPVSIYAKQIV
ncbi:MAG: ParA family protein [Ruminococcaceae bacterium]|nr:ParA family protein [Oscillospiraceae bacterium]